jgi:hypothetical protein
MTSKADITIHVARETLSDGSHVFNVYLGDECKYPMPAYSEADAHALSETLADRDQQSHNCNRFCSGVVTMPALAKTMFLQIGRRRYQVATLEQASQMFCKARDAADCGASEIHAQTIVDESGEVIAHVSYNGRVWAGTPQAWTVDAVPLFDNRSA